MSGTVGRQASNRSATNWMGRLVRSTPGQWAHTAWPGWRTGCCQWCCEQAEEGVHIWSPRSRRPTVLSADCHLRTAWDQTTVVSRPASMHSMLFVPVSPCRHSQTRCEQPIGRQCWEWSEGGMRSCSPMASSCRRGWATSEIGSEHQEHRHMRGGLAVTSFPTM